MFEKTSIIMYYQVGGVTPLSSVTAMTGRAVWIMQLSQFSLSFSHVLLHGVHVDGCYSAPFSLLSFLSSLSRFKQNPKFCFRSEPFMCVRIPFICSPVLFCDRLLQNLAWTCLSVTTDGFCSGLELIPASQSNILIIYLINLIIFFKVELEKHFPS